MAAPRGASCWAGPNRSFGAVRRLSGTARPELELASNADRSVDWSVRQLEHRTHAACAPPAFVVTGRPACAEVTRSPWCPWVDVRTARSVFSGPYAHQSGSICVVAGSVSRLTLGVPMDRSGALVKVRITAPLGREERIT